ncbi:DUF6527 family protein [Pseudorhodoferax sp. LjRoot39]|uniref:DUF6527 family protein n=1 Tax=Pseudorhodoferax sp. LjRoot39 TaxID=3342328 RepID=UPI003ECE0B4E
MNIRDEFEAWAKDKLDLHCATADRDCYASGLTNWAFDAFKAGRAAPASVKALPVKLVAGRYLPCDIGDATHITLNVPGPTGLLTLPVQTSGTRAGTGNWTWNGSTDAPTLRPSVLTTGSTFRCHSWITDGQAQFLDDCDHDMRGSTVDLLAVPADA